MKKIVSKDNHLIKTIIKLRDQRRHRYIDRLFVIEGPTMLQEAIVSGQDICQVLADESRIEVWQEFFDLYPEWEWIMVSPAIFKHISAAKTPNGLMALVKMNDFDWRVFLGEPKLLLLLDAVSDPGNMGTIIRTAWALGIDGILLLPNCVDVYSPKVVRASMGGIFNMPICHVNMEHIEQLYRQGYRIITASADGNQNVYDFDFSGPVLIAIGNERQGISRYLQEINGINLRIPTNPKVDSLNAAIACSIIIAQAWQQRQETR